MTYIRLHRSNGTIMLTVCTSLKDVVQGGYLYRIAEFCSSSMSLDIANLIGVQPSGCQCTGDNIYLSLDAWSCIADFQPAIVVDCGCFDNRHNVVTISQS